MKLTVKGDAVRFEVRARPRARKSQIKGIREGRLEVSLAAAPLEGAANDELLTLLSHVLGVPKAHLTLLRGASGRTKLLEVRGVLEEDLRARLAAAAAT